jgi:hypothetical protein
MAPKKQWANPMREREKYRQVEFNVDGNDYILEVPDGVTTNVIMNNVKKNKPLYEKMASLAKERGYDVDSDTPPMPKVSKEKYVELIRDAKIALSDGWRQSEKIYIKNMADIRGAPYASIYPANKSGTIRKKCARKKSGPPAAGDEPDEDCDDDNEDEPPRKMPAPTPAPATSSSSSAMPMRTPADNPYRTQYTDSMGRVSVTYIANDPKYKERYAMDQYFNKVYFFDDHRKHYHDPLNHRPTQIGYIEGPGLPGSGERMDYMKAVSGETQKGFNISAGDTVHGGMFIYLLKPANKLVIMQDVIKAMEDEKERKEQAKHQAWVDSLTSVTYKGKKIYYEPYDERSGTYELYDNTIEDGVYTNIGDYYPDSNRNPVFDEKKLENFGIQYTGYDTDSDASESVKSERSSSNNGDNDDDYFDPHDDIPRFHRSEMVSTVAPAEPVAPAPATAPSEPEHPPLPLPDGWRLRWSRSRNMWTFIDPATGLGQFNPPGKESGWVAAVSKRYNRWYYSNLRTKEHEWVVSTGGKRSKKKATRRKNKSKKGKKTRNSRTSKKTKKSKKGKNTKILKITLRKIGKKNVRHHYTLDATSKKRHMAIAEGVNKEAKKTNRTRKQAAVAKKARLNVLRMYRKNNNPKQCNIITRDMEYMDNKYKLGKTVNICKK